MTTGGNEIVLRDYYRQAGAADYLGMSVRQIIRETKSGAIAHARLGRKLILYSRRDLDSFFARNRNKAVGEAR